MLSEDRMSKLDNHVRKTCADNPDMEPWHVWSGLLFSSAMNMLHASPFTMSHAADEMGFILSEYSKATMPGYKLPEKDDKCDTVQSEARSKRQAWPGIHLGGLRRGSQR